MKIPLTRPFFDDEEITSLKTCLSSGWVTQGPLTRQFELLVQDYHRVKHALAASSCTAALHLATTALGLGAGDEVIVPAFTWITSANCAEYVGARVVFADVKPETFNLDPQALEAAITDRTRAIVVVHLFGLAAEMDEIMAIAQKHSLKVIEDAACAIGSTYKTTPVGGIGDIGCFSFHPRKIVTTGEGGMVTTHTDELADKVSILRNHGAGGHPGPGEPARPYTMGVFDDLGYNLRLSDIQSAVGVAQMAKLDSLLEERRGLALRYTEILSGMDEFALPPLPGICGHTYQSYVVRLVKGDMAERNALMDYLAASGIQTRPGTHAVHRLGYYANKYCLKPGDFPNAARCEDSSITLPLYPGMTDREQDYVIDEIKKGLSRCRT